MKTEIKRREKNIDLPDSGSIKKLARLLRLRDFLYLASFADMLSRYIEIRFSKQKGFNRLRFAALCFLITHDGSLTPTKLGELMFRSKRCITSIIDQMERESYIVRERVDKDRRVNMVRITSTGIDFLSKMVEERFKDEDEILSSIDKDDYKAMMSSIQKLRHILIQKTTVKNINYSSPVN